MEQHRETPKMMVIFLLTIVNIPASSYSQNLYAFTFDVNPTKSDRLVDRVWSQPLNTTTSVSRENTTDLPSSTSARSKEILDSSETNVLGRYAQPSNRHEEYTGNDDDEDDNGDKDSSEESADHAIPYSGHEEARDVPTKAKYVAPGLWAKPPPDKNIPLDFVPTKLHAQVRGTRTVKRLPQREAIESAETDEEKRNAHRLREVVSNSKVNTVYTEEGYEDSAYDHAGHARDADFHEGFARKLHDRKNDRRDSLSGEKRRKKYRNLVPDDEFEEYDEDYQDHLEKQEETWDDGYNLIGHGEDVWKGSETDPKFVAEDGIRTLREDIEENVVEAERSAKEYQKAQESEVRNDVDIDSSGSEESREQNDLNDEEDEPARKRKISQKEKMDVPGKGTRKLRKLDERKKKLHRANHETTVATWDDGTSSPVDTPASPHGFVTNSASLREYSVDRTTLRYVPPTTATLFQSVDQPTTVSYSQLFWDYLKSTKEDSTKATALVPDSMTTMMTPRVEERTPVAVATIDAHSPYLLVTRDEITTTLPSTYLESPTFHSLFFDGVKFGTGFAHHLPGQSDDGNYIDNINDAIAQSTVATFTSAQALALEESLRSSQPEGAEQSPTLLDGIASSSTPAVATLNFTKEAYSRLADYQANPFLGPILDNSDIAIARDKFKYKVLVRPRPKSPVVRKSSAQRASSSFAFQQEDEDKKIRDELNAKYAKMLDYLESKRKIRPLPDNEKIVFPDLTWMRPPALRQIAYPIFPANHPPLAPHSRASIESESPREANWRGAFSRDQDRSQPNAVETARFRIPLEPFAVIQPVRLSYRKNLLPATRLLPPLPIVNYRSNGQNDDYSSYDVDDERQKRHDNTSKYSSLAAGVTRRATRSRRKRSDDDDAKAAANNGATNESREQRVQLTSNGTTGEAKGKSFDRKIVDAPIDVSSTTEVRNGESVTFAALTNKNSNATADNGESEYVEARREDARGTANRYSELRRALTLLRSKARQAARMNYTSEEKVARKKKRDVLQDKERSGVNVTNRTDGKNHEELLDESARISGDFIEKEIAVRFNGGDTNETLIRNKNVRKVEVEVPILDYVEELAKDSPVELFTTTDVAVNSSKYPFYEDEDVPGASALKYVVDPRTVPRKTSRGMEFYDSRNAYKQCDQVEPDLDGALPEKEEPDPERGSQEDLPRLRGLGEKLDCYKAKYFDEDPLDNPLFSEKLIEGPTPPSELDPTKFASKVLLLPKENDEYVVHRLSKKPERRNGRRWRNRSPQYQSHESIRVNYGHDPQTGRGKNAHLHTVRGSKPFAAAPKRGPPTAVRRVNNRRTRPKVSSTTPITPKLYQTASYQNQVYEDVMGNIRNMANAYRVYEMTTELPPVTQTPATASSEAALEVSTNVTTNSSSREKTTADVTSDKKSSEIKGLLPPPKYTTPRQATYRKHRPPGQGKGRIPLLRSPNLPRIIAHHHTVKINKRSTTEDIAKNSSANTNDEDNGGALGKSIRVNADGRDRDGESMEETMKKIANLTVMDMEIEESRQIQIRNRHLENNDQKKRRNSTSSDQRDESPQRIVYTIKDRIRYSKPKWDTTRFGKFKANARSTVDKDSRRKEPRYNYFKREKINPNRWNNSTMPPRYNSTASTSDIESASSSAEGGESGTTEIYRLAESVLQRSIYDKKNAPEESEPSVIDSKSNGRVEKESKRTTNTYRVHEDIDEDVPAITTKRTNIFNSKETLDLQEYLETDAPGYAFRDRETTTPSNEYSANTKTEERDGGETKDEEAEYPEKLTSPWEKEKSSEQLETPAKAESSAQEDSSEEFSSKEEEGSNDDRAFFRYTTRDPSFRISENKHKDDSEKAMFYHATPFSRYKSMRKEESDEDDVVSVSEEEKEKDYVFPWHADKEGSERERLQDRDRFEYPWERRERLAEREQRRKQRRVNRFGKTIFDDDEEESERYEKPVYPWERYNVPSKNHANTRHDVSPSITDDGARSSTEQLPLVKFSSKYSSVDKSTMRPSSAREISESIEKFLHEDFNVESGEERSKESIDRSSSSARKSSLVPENITHQPSRKRRGRKRSGRKGISPQTDESVSSSSLFNSKELRGKEIDDKEEEPATEYLKLNKSNSNGSESQVETANGKSRTSSPITRRKKRRRRISNNNSTISLDNATAESITEPIGRRRRKSEASATTSATLSAGNDLETISMFAPIPSRYSKTNDVVETNKSSSFGRIFTDEIAGANNTEVEASTPKVRTVEHRSRVSKEKIVTKTTYPNETKDFDYRKRSVISTREDPANKLKVKLNRRRNVDRQNANDRNQNDKGKSTKRKDGKRNYDTKLNNEDEINRLMVLDKPKVKNGDNSLKSLGMRKDEIKQINNFSAFDGLISDEGDSGNGDDFGSIITSEIYAVSNLLQNIPPSRRNGRNGANNMTGNESNIAKQNGKERISSEKEGGREEKQKSLLQTKYIKDPERRLYYYVARK